MKLRVKYSSPLVKGRWLGFVLYPFMFFKDSRNMVNDTLFRHEMEHVYQVRQDGWLYFYTHYIWWHFKYGYERNPYELAARLVQDNELTTSERYWKESSMQGKWNV